jgi:uncharacterized membrane protein YhhN
MTSTLVVLCTLAVVGLLIAERQESALGKWLTKPLASALFIAIAVAGGACEHSYGQAIVVGLILSFFGDVLLIPAGAGTPFRLGAASFLLGHVAYSAAFLVRGADLPLMLLAATIMVVPAVIVLGYLGPKVPEHMRALVRAYIAVISIMVTLAIGTHLHSADPRILVGAAMFYVSDLSVARDRFIGKSFANRAWGLPLYYGGQILLALSAT